jgi:hypothetical protein
MIAFVVNVFREPTAVIAACVASVRAIYPAVPLTLIDDGGGNPDLDSIAEEHGARLVRGAHIMPTACGSWLARCIQAGVDAGADVIVKIDPDTRLHRAFRTIPADGGACGYLMPYRFGLYPHGACKALSRACALDLLSSGALTAIDHITDPVMMCALRGHTHPIAEDIALALALRDRRWRVTRWAEVLPGRVSPSVVHDFAATHGYKT